MLYFAEAQTKQLMKVLDVSFSFDQTVATPLLLLKQHYTIEGWANALHTEGTDIAVVKRYSINALIEEKGINHHFIKDGLSAHLKPWQVPFRLIWFIKKQRADIVHVHGFMFPMAVFFLRLILGKKVSIIVQHHAGRPSKGWKRFCYALLNSVANGYFFTTPEQGFEWFGSWNNKVMPIMEGSNYLQKNDKDLARAVTGMQGSPIFLWVGRLDENKDPITVLEGFELLLQQYPSCSLYMVYGDDALLQEVQIKITQSRILQSSVHLIGNVDHDQLENYYNSADYFVLGSHHEGSGYALSEALACGCIPIVTDIPSFRMMTNNGTLGTLWQTGNSSSFVDAAVEAMEKDRETESKKCTEFFDQELSFDAIASKAIGYYESAISR